VSNNTILNTNVTSGDVIATEDIGGVKHELIKVEFGVDGIATKVSATDPLPVTTDGLTDAELRATPVTVSGTVTVDTSTLATAAKQDTGNSSLSSILAKIITAPATEAKQDIGNSSVSSIDTKLTSQATASKQDTGNTSLASIDSKLTINPTQMLLSGSTNGKGIKVTGTSTGATVTIHTATSNNTSTQFDEIYLYAYNGHTADVVLTIEWGEATVPDGNIILTVPFKQGRVLPIDGRPLNNSLVVKAFAATANVIIIDGFIKRYS
jgi:hypothetical protein